jgi:hypothetical protein
LGSKHYCLKIKIMNKQLKIAVIITAIIGAGIGGYFVYQYITRQSGNPIKDKRNITFTKG